MIKFLKAIFNGKRYLNNSFNSRLCKVKFGFTLAEVLVTLGIIGVVSAMTVPTLMQNYQRKSYVTQLHKFYNELSQALVQYQTDRNALNYNPSANKDDGSCIAKILGCTDKTAINYNSSANANDNSCQYEKEITETKKVKYKTKYIDNNEMDKGQEKVKTAGKDGETKVVYTVTLDAFGNEIDREKKSETVTLEAVEEVIERGTYENSSPVIGISWIVCLIIAFYQAFKNKDGNLLLNKIQKQKDSIAIILYILYVITIVPAFIDVILIIINKLKQKNSKKEMRQ